MVRGRLDILTQRIAFDRGIITFAGDLDPILDFVGTTQSGDVSISVTVSGRASDPEVLFSSIPELPQDEVLARLIFQKGIGELSPVQIARLAAAAAELSGGSGGLLGQLRESTGLDDLDIVMDEEGAPSLAAGRYVSENVYIGVQQGTTAEFEPRHHRPRHHRGRESPRRRLGKRRLQPRRLLRAGILRAGTA